MCRLNMVWPQAHGLGEPPPPPVTNQGAIGSGGYGVVGHRDSQDRIDISFRTIFLGESRLIAIDIAGNCSKIGEEAKEGITNFWILISLSGIKMEKL